MNLVADLVSLQPELAPDRRVEFPWAISRMKEVGNVLDVGCGGSIIEKYLENKGFSVVAIDISKDLGGTYYNREKRECFVLCDCFKPPFKLGSFDYVLVVSTIEHFEEDGEALKALVPLIKKNGKILVTVPYGESAWKLPCTRIYDDRDLKERLVSKNALKLTNKEFFKLDWYKNIACLELTK